MTRDEHLEWAKRRAIRELDRGEDEAAYNSFMSDMSKHDELKAEMIEDVPSLLAMKGAPAPFLRIWILGFS